MPAALARADPKEQIPLAADVVLLDIHRLPTHRAGVALGGCCGVPGGSVGGELSLVLLQRTGHLTKVRERRVESSILAAQ